MTYDGRIEARFTVPAGGAAVSATNSGGGPSTCTVAAGNYYFTAAGGVSSIITVFAAALNAGRPDDWTVTFSTTTGKVTIDCADEPWELVWTSTVLRDLLGFTGNISSTTSAQTGANQARGLWIPDCPPSSQITDHANAPRRTDRHSTRGPTGVVISHTGNLEYFHPRWSYSHVVRERVFLGSETTVNASWEKFLLDVAWAQGLSWFDGSALVQVYDIGGLLVGRNANGAAGLGGWYLTGPGVANLQPSPSAGQTSRLWRIDGFDLESSG